MAAKNCLNCPYIYWDCWEEHPSYCFRDKEFLDKPKTKEVAHETK